MEAVLDPLRSPTLPKYIQQLKDTLVEEPRKHQQFHDTMREGDNVEFINGGIIMQPPVHLEHNDASFTLAIPVRTFSDVRNLSVVGHEKLMISLTRNDDEPNVRF